MFAEPGYYWNSSKERCTSLYSKNLVIIHSLLMNDICKYIYIYRIKIKKLIY